MTVNARMIRPRIFRGTVDQPLTREQIEHVAPAVFSMNPFEGMSDIYEYIPTITILERMWDAGFEVYEVAQQRPYRTQRDPYAKHMLRLRHHGAIKKERKVGDYIPEVVLINAHDGTSRYFLYGGIFRLICTNGMVVGSNYTGISVRHVGEGTAKQVIDGSYAIIEEQFPRMIKEIDTFSKIKLTQDQQIQLAERALLARYPNGTEQYAPQQLLATKRSEDEGDDLWRVLNRVQEHIIEGGLPSRSFMYDRASKMKPIENVNARVSVNRLLWTAASELALAA